jgi:D-amino-acid oxidase
MWAGAHVRPIPGDTPQLRREGQWLKSTVAELRRQLESEPWIGIGQVPGMEYLDEPSSGYMAWDAASFEADTELPGYRRIATSQLPKDVKLGYQYQTFCINSPLYCSNLLRKFILNGGRTMQRHLASEAEAFYLADNVSVVVNANGTGFGDPKSFPTRGRLDMSTSLWSHRCNNLTHGGDQARQS